jgi:hypothetical protein
MKLPAAGTGNDDEIIEVAGQLAHVQNDDVRAAIILGGPRGEKGPFSPPGEWIRVRSSFRALLHGDILCLMR